MPNEDRFAVGAFVRFLGGESGSEVVRESYADQMPTVSGNAVILQSEEGALIVSLNGITEVQVEYDFRSKEEAENIMFKKMGLTDEEIAELKKEEDEGGSTEQGTSASEGPDAPVIRLDFGAGDETPEEETDPS